ncbi:hypothetical protein ACHAW5_007601 [Stephanodiscus triporus]|uniref:Uncharacterized protein n=1 Tax=Stephanodiscus triporus TaxID=2934178 RepID=A0ABD3MKD9_9STRA
MTIRPQSSLGVPFVKSPNDDDVFLGQQKFS